MDKCIHCQLPVGPKDYVSVPAHVLCMTARMQKNEDQAKARRAPVRGKTPAVVKDLCALCGARCVCHLRKP